MCSLDLVGSLCVFVGKDFITQFESSVEHDLLVLLKRLRHCGFLFSEGFFDVLGQCRWQWFTHDVVVKLLCAEFVEVNLLGRCTPDVSGIHD